MRKVIFIALSLISIVGNGQGIKISALPQAGSLSGSELTPVVQNGITKKTTVQSIANLGGGGGSQNLQSVTTIGNTTSNNIQLLDSGNLIIGAYGGVLLDNSTSLKEGTFDNGTGGSKGVSLNCAVGYELNWQGGHLSSSQNSGATKVPIIVDSTLQLNGLSGNGNGVVGVDNNGLLSWSAGGVGGWSLTGNSGTNPATNFIGTTDGADFIGGMPYLNNKFRFSQGRGIPEFHVMSPLFYVEDSNTTTLFKIASSANGFNTHLFIEDDDKRITLRDSTFENEGHLKNIGTVEIVDGTQGAGKVLTSDANGLASWQSPDSLLPYYTYVALISQADTLAPTAIVLQNSLGNITYSREVAGTYHILSSSLFTADKTFLLSAQYTGNGGDIESTTFTRISDNDIMIVVAGSPDNFLNQNPLEIRVYK
jgi:hypothetical protein